MQLRFKRIIYKENTPTMGQCWTSATYEFVVRLMMAEMKIN